MTFGLIVLEFVGKNKKEIIIKLVQQSKALKSIGVFYRQFYRSFYFMLQVTSSDFDPSEGTVKKVLRGGFLIVLEYGRKNKTEIIIKVVQQSKGLKSMGKLFDRYYYCTRPIITRS